MKKNQKLSLLLLIGIVFITISGNSKEFKLQKSRFEGVKVYEQASTSSLVIKSLEKDEEIIIVRKSVLNGGIWTIVSLDGKPGYVLNSELYQDNNNLEEKKTNQKARKTKTAQQLLSS